MAILHPCTRCRPSGAVSFSDNSDTSMRATSPIRWPVTSASLRVRAMARVMGKFPSEPPGRRLTGALSSAVHSWWISSSERSRSRRLLLADRRRKSRCRIHRQQIAADAPAQDRPQQLEDAIRPVRHLPVSGTSPTGVRLRGNLVEGAGSHRASRSQTAARRQYEAGCADEHRDVVAYSSGLLFGRA